MMVGLGLLLASGMIGCGPDVRLTLRQPFAPPSQRALQLTSDTAVFAAHGTEQRCVLTFPLPSSKNGPRAFVVYLVAPDRLGSIVVDPLEPGGADGFMIQEIGALAGRSNFVGGTINARRVWLSSDRRVYELDVRCEDGARIVGRAKARAVPRQVVAFEQDFAGDIAQLAQDTEASAPPPDDAEPAE